jgi:hypothetical protein
MKKRTKEQMAEYQRNRRKGLKPTSQDAPESNKSVTPDTEHPQNVTPKAVTPAECNTQIVTPCNTCKPLPVSLRPYGHTDNCHCLYCESARGLNLD